MTLRQRLDEDLKQAMRSGETVRRDTLRGLRSAIHNEEIARHKELDDEGIAEVIGKQAKQRRESIEAFQQGNREDLVRKEQAELDVLTAYLPQQLTRDEVAELARAAIQETGAATPSDKGKVMGRLMPQVKGRADGALVNAVVTELLQSSG